MRVREAQRFRRSQPCASWRVAQGVACLGCARVAVQRLRRSGRVTRGVAQVGQNGAASSPPVDNRTASSRRRPRRTAGRSRGHHDRAGRPRLPDERARRADRRLRRREPQSRHGSERRSTHPRQRLASAASRSIGTARRPGATRGPDAGPRDVNAPPNATRTRGQNQTPTRPQRGAKVAPQNEADALGVDTPKRPPQNVVQPAVLGCQHCAVVLGLALPR